MRVRGLNLGGQRLYLCVNRPTTFTPQGVFQNLCKRGFISLEQDSAEVNLGKAQSGPRRQISALVTILYSESAD